jgi:hypothetical protein
MKPTYQLTRFLLLRALGAVYLVAFSSLAQQLLPLFGRHGLLPVERFLSRDASGFVALPSLFWIDASDTTLRIACWLGIALALALLLGVTNACVNFALWFLYLSFVHVGQIFYSFGWEILLLEAGFLAVFLASPTGWHPLDARPPSPVVIYLYRWLLFRVMLGAGLIKLRGDECWRDFSCLVYHYETQPLPNPLSWLLHQMPPWFHSLGVLFNHFVELIVPWFLFWPRRLALIAGLFEIAFQLTLILSGNLSWLNWLTLSLAIACFDDQALATVLPARLRPKSDNPPSVSARVTAWILASVIALLSIDPITNLLSPGQQMNASFERLHIVNTYGAFGSVGRIRPEIVIEGSSDGVHWTAYEFKCKPGDPARRPCIVAPWQLRVDWQIWFAAMSRFERQPWLARLVEKLLENDRGARSLLANDPFPTAPPRYVRGQLYEYHFTRFGQPGWWTRDFLRSYFPPVERGDPDLRLVADLDGDDDDP